MGFPPQGTTPVTITRAEYIDRIPYIESDTDRIENAVLETEWSTAPATDNVSSVAETELTIHTIPADEFVYPTGATEVRVILLAVMTAHARDAATHHIGVKVRMEVNDGGWADLVDFTADPPIGLATEGAMANWAMPIEITDLVDSGDKLELRFAVDSDNAGSVTYTTSFIVVLNYRLG